jgi:hypothetical protein
MSRKALATELTRSRPSYTGVNFVVDKYVSNMELVFACTPDALWRNIRSAAIALGARAAAA